jgi:hypothetical protein
MFLTTKLFLFPQSTSVKNIITAHLFHYSIKQKIYTEVLTDSSFWEKYCASFFDDWQQQPHEIYMVNVFISLLLMSILYSYWKDINKQLIDKNKNKTNISLVYNEDIYIYMKQFEIILFIFTIIFTKDVNNAI